MNNKVLKLLSLGVLLFSVSCGNTTTEPTVNPTTETPTTVTTTTNPTTVTPTTQTPTTAKPTTVAPTTAKPTTVAPTTAKPTTTVTPTTQTPTISPDLPTNKETIKETLNIMSFNIRNENTSDKGNTNWSVRGKYVEEFIANSGMDIIAFQEVKFTQYYDLAKGLEGQYNFFFAPREVSKNPEGLMIAYNNDFELVEKEMFWLSPTPDTYGYGYDKQYRRISANTLLRTKNGAYIDVYSAHLGLNTSVEGEGETIRTNELKTIIERRKDTNYPKVIMGDFNTHRTGSAWAYIDELMIDCQMEAPETDMVATFNGWDKANATGTTMIDYIFVSDEMSPKKFDVHQEMFELDGTLNLYSDHYAVEATVDLSYERENLSNVSSIEFEGDVNITTDVGTKMIDANVVATFKDGTKGTIPEDFYTINLPDSMNAGELYEVTATLNGNANIKATKQAVVHNRYQAELCDNVLGGSVNTEEHKLIVDGEFVSDKLYSFLGDFDKTVVAGDESSFTFDVFSESNSKTDMVFSAGNGNVKKSGSLYYMAELQVNTILDVFVNGVQVAIPDSAKFEQSITNSAYAPLYQVSEKFTIEDVMLLEGNNTIKCQFKVKADGEKTAWGRSPSSMNIDYIDFITTEKNISSDSTVESIAVKDTTFTVGMKFSDIKVEATLSNGVKRILAASEFTASTKDNPSATSFYYGNYVVDIVLNIDSTIKTSINVNLIDYHCKAIKADIYVENDKLIYELRFENRGYTAEDYDFFWTAANHIYKGTCTMENEIAIFKFDATDLIPNESGIAILPHLRLTKVDGSVDMYVNGKNANGDILSTDGSLVYENGKSLTLNGKKYTMKALYEMPALYIENVA